MTTNDIEISSQPIEPGDKIPQPTFTLSQAKQGNLTTHKIYVLAGSIRIVVVQYHLQAGTPRHEWEPTEIAGRMLSDRYNDETTEKLETACREELDPRVQKIEDRLAEIDATVQAVASRDVKVTSSETGFVYSEDEAVNQVESNTSTMAADQKQGRTHHKRVPSWVRVLGKIMPYAEALGLIVLLSFWLNVNWLRPWEDPLTWTLSVVVVLATLLFTPRVVERAAEGWNKRREAAADGQAEAVRRADRAIVINGSIAAIICVAIVAGLVERALAVTDASLPKSMLALIIALCIIAGLAMPAFALLAVAWDGSTYSRENANLIEQLEAGRAEDQELRIRARSLNTANEHDELHINTEVAPTIYRIADESVEDMRRAYAWLRVQIGGLPSAPPVRSITEVNETDVRRSIQTEIPGADSIRLDALVDRGLRIKQLKIRRESAMTRLDALAPHPWSGSQI